LSLHICKWMKFLLYWHPRNVTKMCTKPSDWNWKIIPFYKCGQIDKCELCLAHNIVTPMCSMFMKSWAILGFNGPIVSFRHNIIGDMGCNYMFNYLFFSVVCDKVEASFNTPTPCLEILPIMGFHYWWSLDLLVHQILQCDIISMFWLWSNVFKWLELVPSPDCNSEGVAYAFFDKILSRFGALVKVFTNQGINFMGNFKNYVRKH
jgi:hypothetical protein